MTHYKVDLLCFQIAFYYKYSFMFICLMPLSSLSCKNVYTMPVMFTAVEPGPTHSNNSLLSEKQVSGRARARTQFCQLLEQCPFIN